MKRKIQGMERPRQQVSGPQSKRRQVEIRCTLDTFFEWVAAEILENILLRISRKYDFLLVRVCRRWRAFIRSMRDDVPLSSPLQLAIACIEDNQLALFQRLEEKNLTVQWKQSGWKIVVTHIARHGRLAFLEYLDRVLTTQKHGCFLENLLTPHDMSEAALGGHPTVLKYIREHSRTKAGIAVIYNAFAGGSKECIQVLQDVIEANPNQHWDGHKMLHTALMASSLGTAERIMHFHGIGPLLNTLKKLAVRCKTKTLAWLLTEQGCQWTSLILKAAIDAKADKTIVWCWDFLSQYPPESIPGNSWQEDIIAYGIRRRSSVVLRKCSNVSFENCNAYIWAIRGDSFDPVMLEWVYQRMSIPTAAESLTLPIPPESHDTLPARWQLARATGNWQELEKLLRMAKGFWSRNPDFFPLWKNGNGVPWNTVESNVGT